VWFRNAGATELDKTGVGKIDKKRLREALETLKRRCIGRRNSRFRTGFRNDLLGRYHDGRKL
jgi:hypothetical protein